MRRRHRPPEEAESPLRRKVLVHAEGLGLQCTPVSPGDLTPTQ